MKRLLVAFMVALGLLTAVPGCVVYEDPPAAYAEVVPPGAVWVDAYTYYTVTVVDGVMYRHYWRWDSGRYSGRHGYYYHSRVIVRGRR